MSRGRRLEGSPGGAALVARCVVALLLPLLVATLQPQGGAAGAPLVLVAAAVGAVLAVAVPLRISVLAGILVVGLLLSSAHLKELQAKDPDRVEETELSQPPIQAGLADVVDAARSGHAAAVAAGTQPRERARTVEQVASLRWRPMGLKPQAPVTLETFSVVLPCAFEGNFAEKTVEAVWEFTDHSRLREIIVVDDGSRPPLRTIFPDRLLRGGPDAPPLRILRHETTRGLIAAKKTGGDAARGDVIVFFDCHISPRRGWETAFIKQMSRAGDHRTIVVPTITSLDPDTWKEIDNSGGGKACYILWNNDFTWLGNSGRDVPLMSGGLLAISRLWWEETGGYDDKMVAWGGENIDQSLRSWLCGGRIEVAEGAYVAHMWRDPKNPKTTLRYPIPTKDVMRNKARAATAWFGPFTEKVFTFPEYEQFTKYHESLGDMSGFEKLKSKLQCAPFSAYLSRFSYVYIDSGLIPVEVFQLRERNSGLCLERVMEESQPHSVVLAPCSGGDGGGQPAELQLWHLGNRDRRRHGKPCCSGLMNWNFLQCLDAQAVGSQVRTFECEISGGARNQLFSLSEHAQLVWRPKSPGSADGDGCVSFAAAKVADVLLKRGSSNCHTVIQPVGSELVRKGGSTMPARFQLQSRLHDKPETLCATVAAASVAESTTGLKLQFQRCDPEDTQQVFHASAVGDGFQIQAGDTGECLDAGSGTKLLVYPCYDWQVPNRNQVWKAVAGHLTWEGGHCVDLQELANAGASRRDGEYTLRTCAPKVGQQLRREDVHSDGTFMIRDIDAGQCLGMTSSSRSTLALVECDARQRWRELTDREQVQHVTSGMCLDAGDEVTPMLYQCHVPRAMKKQRFRLVDTPGWIQMLPTWGDNGRKRWLEKCLDRAPVVPLDVSVQRCESTRKRGIHWEVIHKFIPLERRLWDEAEKPPEGVVLGGDAEPP